MRRFTAIILVLGMVDVLADAARAEGLAATAQAAISRYRAEHGLAAVTADPRLMALAAEQARAMAKTGALEHDVDRPFQARIVRYDPGVAVENIAGGTKDFSSTLEMWKHSPGHDANLRKSGVTRFGIASADSPDSKYKIFWALILAGSDARHGLRQAGGPGVMRAAPGAGPAVRVRAERSPERQPDLMAGVKRLLRPLWQSGSAKEK
jgi:Cysteine-rich secretory protein family